MILSLFAYYFMHVTTSQFTMIPYSSENSDRRPLFWGIIEVYPRILVVDPMIMRDNQMSLWIRWGAKGVVKDQFRKDDKAWIVGM